MANGSVVENRKPIPPIIVAHAELRIARNRLKLLRVRTKSKITPPDGPRGASVRPAHVPIATSIRAVNPVVEPPVQTVDPELLVSFGKSGKHLLACVCDPIPVGVGQKPNIRRGGDEHAVLPRDDPVRKREIGRKDNGALISPIAV